MREGYKYWVGSLAAIFLGMIFVIAGIGKLLTGTEGFLSLVSMAFIPQNFLKIISSGLPYLEIIVGTLLILGIAVRFGAGLAALLILGFMISNLVLIYLGVGFEPCGGCFGVVGEFTAISALALDAVMAVMVVAIFTYYQGSFFWIFPVVLRREKV